MEKEKTVTCPFYKTEMSVKVCLARQKIVADQPTEGNEAIAYDLYKNKCGECVTGLNLYREFMAKNKPAPVVVPGPSLTEKHTHHQESKICPCGKEFFRKVGQGAVSWTRTRYCDECLKLTQYYRKKKFGSGIVEHKRKASPTGEATQQVETAPAPGYTDIVAEDCKRCECGTIFVRKDGMPAVVWENQRYCSEHCAKEAVKKRDRVRKKAARKRNAGAKVFDREEAARIATEVTEESLKLVAPFITDEAHLKQLRSFAARVGLDAQRRAHDLVWGANS